MQQCQVLILATPESMEHMHGMRLLLKGRREGAIDVPVVVLLVVVGEQTESLMVVCAAASATLLGSAVRICRSVVSEGSRHHQPLSYSVGQDFLLPNGVPLIRRLTDVQNTH